MTNSDAPSAKQRLEAALESQDTQRYVLRLYVAGLSARSQSAIQKARAFCEEHLAGRYDLEVVDIYQNPVLAKGQQIIATPTLVKELPQPLRKIIGSLADEEKVLIGLDLKLRER